MDPLPLPDLLSPDVTASEPDDEPDPGPDDVEDADEESDGMGVPVTWPEGAGDG